MKLTIREGCWETNSSSVHAIAISKQKIDVNEALSLYGQRIKFRRGEYGWEHRLYGDLNNKASYLYEAIWNVYPVDKYTGKKYLKDQNRALNWIYDVLTKHGFIVEFEGRYSHEYMDESFCDSGYIDHGYELITWVESIIGNEKRLMSYLFGNSEICTSNDNSYMDDLDDFLQGHPEKDYEIFVKEN